MSRIAIGGLVRWARCLCLGSLLLAISLGAQAQPAPPHLVGFARSLLGQIDQEDLSKLPDDAARDRLRTLVGRSRLAAWNTPPVSAPVDIAKLAEPLGLALDNAEHRGKLDAILAARDGEARRRAVAEALAIAGRPRDANAVEQTLAAFNSAQGEQLQDLPRNYDIPAGDGEQLRIEWDPDTASVVVRAQLADGEEFVLTGAAEGKLDGDQLSFGVTPDATPVSHYTREDMAALRQDIFGVWRDSGDIWLIRRPGEEAARRAAAADPKRETQNELGRLRERLAALRAERVYVWADPRNGGQVIQKDFKRLPEPFVYRRDLSASFNAEEIARLEQRIGKLDEALKSSAIDAHDPVGARSIDRLNRNPEPIEIEVWTASGRIFRYDEASFDGERITASRILRVKDDITDLPEDVIRQLIASWSPPEWIDLAVKLNPRAPKPELDGTWWRLHVTRDGWTNQVTSIHTPYNRLLRLTREPSDVAIRVVDLDGNTVASLGEEDPFRVEVKFTEPPAGEVEVVARWASGAARVIVTPDLASGLPDELNYVSDIHYLRPQAAAASEHRGLLHDSRYMPDVQLAERLGEWQRESERAASTAARQFKGEWSVTHSVEGAAPKIGLANVADDGRSAWLALKDGDDVRRFHSYEMRALEATDGSSGHLFEIRFEEGPTPGERAPLLKPLIEGKFIFLPDGAADVSFEVEQVSATAGSQVRPVGERLRVLLAQRSEARLAGRWNEEAKGGGYGASGQQSWARDIKIAGVVVLDDQRDRGQSSTTFFPWGTNGYLGRGGANRRTLFVYGKNLPESYGDAVAIDTQSERIAYPNYKLRSEIGTTMEREAWRKAKVADPSGLTAILVEATFEKGVMPGFKSIFVNGAGGAWHLDFADANGFVRFAHEDEETVMSPTDVLFSSDIGFIEVKLETPIEFGQIDLTLTHQPGEGWGEGSHRPVATIPITASLAGAIGGLSFRTGPLHTYRSDRSGYEPPPAAGALRLDVRPGDQLIATLSDPTRLLPIYSNHKERRTEALVVDKPADLGALWVEALRRAARCHGDPTNWNARTVADEYSKRILTEGMRKRSIPITIGDHAAALLIRDEFVAMTREILPGYQSILASEAELEGFRRAARGARQRDVFWQVNEATVNGRKVPLEDTLDPDGNAAAWGLTVERASAAAREQTKAALTVFVGRINASITRAQAAGDCNLDELMVIGGQRSDPVVARLIPRLVKLADDPERQYWVPDTVARAYVKSLYNTGDAIKALKEYAAIDEAYQAMALALVGGGAAFAISRAGMAGAAAYAMIGADAADMLYFGTKGIIDHLDAKDLTRYAQGAAAALGSDFYEEAKGAESEWYWAAIGAVAPAAGIGMGVKGLRDLGRVAEGARLARQMGSFDPARMAQLSDAERADLLAYLSDIKAKDTKFAKQGAVGRQLDHTTRLAGEEKAFLQGFDRFLASQKAQVERGATLARSLDDVDEPSLARLSPEQRADLDAYMRDVQHRGDVIASGKAEGPRIRGVGQWEADAKARYDAILAKAGEGQAGAARRVSDANTPARVADAGQAGGDVAAAGSRASDEPRGNAGLLEPRRPDPTPPDGAATQPARPRTPDQPTRTGDQPARPATDQPATPTPRPADNAPRPADEPATTAPRADDAARADPVGPRPETPNPRGDDVARADPAAPRPDPPADQSRPRNGAPTPRPDAPVAPSRTDDVPPPERQPVRVTTRTPDPEPPPAISLRRSPEQVTRRDEAIQRMRQVERDGLQALQRMDREDAATFARAVDEARGRFNRVHTFEDMTPDEVRLMRVGDDLAREALQFDNAARGRTFNDVSPARAVDPAKAPRQMKSALDSVADRLERARRGYQIARNARDPELRQAARQLKETADDLTFRQSVLQKMIADAEGDPARLAKITERDIDWLSGRRARLAPEELAEAEGVLARNGERWTKMLKDKDLSPAGLHRLITYRRELVNTMLDDVIKDVEQVTGEKIERLAFGSNNLTSDYDLSVKVEGGAGAGEVVRRFNNEFRSRYSRESGTVFDTNVYTDPAYNFVPVRSAEGGVLDLAPRERDAYRQAMFQESKARRYMNDAQWAEHKAVKLDGTSVYERRALDGLFGEVERNHATTKAWKDDELAKRIGGKDELDILRASPLDEDQARLKELELEVYNRRYEELLGSVDQFAREQQRLADLNFNGGSAGLRDGLDPGLTRTVRPDGALGDLNAYGRALNDMEQALDDAARLRAVGDEAGALLKQAEAEAVRLEWAERLAGQVRSRQGQALHFASEAYQTDGTIAHVVGELQAGGRKVTAQSLRTPPVDPPLPREQYLNSLHENRADRFKELNAARDPVTGTFKDPAKAAAKAAKYSIRELDAAHQAGLRLADLPDQRVIDATVAVDGVRGNLDDVSRALRDLGLDADAYVRMAEDASNRLVRQAQGASELRREAGDLARYMGEQRAALAIEEAGLARPGVLDDVSPPGSRPPPPADPLPGGLPRPPRQVGVAVDPPDGMAPVFRQEDCRTCGAAAARSVIARTTGHDPTEAAIVHWSNATGRGYRATDGGTWPGGMVDILEQGGVNTRVPYGRRFADRGISPAEGDGVARPVGDTAGRTVAPDPKLDDLRFTLDDATRELRDGNQVLAVVDYRRGRGIDQGTPHWVTIEKVGSGRVVQDGRMVIDGPYVIIGDPAVGKSVAMARDDFMRHWRPDGTVIALDPRNAPALPRAADAPPVTPATSAGSTLAPGGRLSLGDNTASPSVKALDERMQQVIAHDPVAASTLGELAAEYDKYIYALRVQGLTHQSPKVHRIADRIARMKNALPRPLRGTFDERIAPALKNGEMMLGGKIGDYVEDTLGFQRTTPAHRVKVRSENYRNPFTTGDADRFLPPPADIQADHIVPVARISQWPEFKSLKDWEKQMEIIHNHQNIIGLPQRWNGSKADRLADDWNAHLQTNYGRSLSPEYVKWLRDEQERVEELLRKQIICLGRASRIEDCRSL